MWLSLCLLSWNLDLICFFCSFLCCFFSAFFKVNNILVFSILFPLLTFYLYLCLLYFLVVAVYLESILYLFTLYIWHCLFPIPPSSLLTYTSHFPVTTSCVLIHAFHFTTIVTLQQQNFIQLYTLSIIRLYPVFYLHIFHKPWLSL